MPPFLCRKEDLYPQRRSLPEKKIFTRKEDLYPKRRSLSVNGSFDGIDRTINVTIGAGLQALREHVVLIMADVLSRLPQIIQRCMQTAGMIDSFVYMWMILEILTVFNRRFLDLADGSIDAVYRCDLILRLHPVARTMFDHPARCPQIGQSVQVIRMRPCNIRGTGAVNAYKGKEQDRAYRQKVLDFQLQFHVHDFKLKNVLLHRTQSHAKD
jgi:hypothetical protein